MANNSPTTIIGNATKQPELRFTSSGTAVATFGVAVNERYFDKQANDWKDKDPSFFNVVAWGQLGENIAESIQKGTRVIVFGKLQQRQWETQDGEKRSGVEVVAEAIGPDLRFSTATVTRNERREGSTSRPESGGGGYEYDPNDEPF